MSQEPQSLQPRRVPGAPAPPSRRVPIGERIRELRAERAWSQDELVRRSGLSKGTIQNLETGRHDPRLSSLYRLAEAFGVAVHALMAGHPGGLHDGDGAARTGGADGRAALRSSP
jgi:putative transcriptional regulator